MNKISCVMVISTLFSLAGCAGGLYLPEGDAEAGRQVFTGLQCHKCHRVQGEDFPAPVADPPVSVVLGRPLERKSREYLAESIISPSHRYARPEPVMVDLEFGIDQQREYQNIKEGTLSRMGDFSETMTVRQWLDLVAYLESLYSRKPAGPSN